MRKQGRIYRPTAGVLVGRLHGGEEALPGVD